MNFKKLLTMETTPIQNNVKIAPAKRLSAVQEYYFSRKLKEVATLT